ncbi:unnamed protein product [Paramecium pentaurelia]|uniref:Transmembrane protein n=1 Tax=Paramecium pentaurelia TaxID=43138 RepID=A0A8S1UCN2_9CILI|nr:unnamed protein product [Paramecium pentaurelia]
MDATVQLVGIRNIIGHKNHIIITLIFLRFKKKLICQLQFKSCQNQNKTIIHLNLLQISICKISLYSKFWVIRIIGMDHNDFQRTFCISMFYSFTFALLVKGFTLTSQDRVKVIELYGLFIFKYAIIFGLNIIK